MHITGLCLQMQIGIASAQSAVTREDVVRNYVWTQESTQLLMWVSVCVDANWHCLSSNCNTEEQVGRIRAAACCTSVAPFLTALYRSALVMPSLFLYSVTLLHCVPRGQSLQSYRRVVMCKQCDPLQLLSIGMSYCSPPRDP